MKRLNTMKNKFLSSKTFPVKQAMPIIGQKSRATSTSACELDLCFFCERPPLSRPKNLTFKIKNKFIRICGRCVSSARTRRSQWIIHWKNRIEGHLSRKKGTKDIPIKRIVLSNILKVI